MDIFVKYNTKILNYKSYKNSNINFLKVTFNFLDKDIMKSK